MILGRLDAIRNDVVVNDLFRAHDDEENGP